jgi:hypothetical protein
MALGPKERTANKPLKPEEMAQLMGTRSAFYGCPDTRQEITLGPTLAQLLAGKGTQAALAGYLAAVKSNYEIHGHVPDEYLAARNVPIPIEVIALIGEKLLEKGAWSKTYNVVQAEAARKQAAKRQAQAVAIWLKNAHCTRELELRPPVAGRLAGSKPRDKGRLGGRATRWALAGAPLLVVVARALGHATTRMTEMHYAHLSLNFEASATLAGNMRLGRCITR